LTRRPPSTSWLFCIPAIALIAGSVLLFKTATAFDLDRLLNTYSRFSNGRVSSFQSWQKLLMDSRALPVADRLARVNQFFNQQTRFEEDQQAWGQSDYWATPMETLAKGAGDCEDFTIAKYFTLLNLDVPVDQLRLIYVKARIGGPASSIQQAHMVLAYYASPDAEPMVLDNLITDIRPASRRPDLQPVFSFNSQGVFAGAAANSGASGSVSRLSRWQDLLQRARSEGFD
jgi:predicted transglutaminase-like cysteine proteinase